MTHYQVQKKAEDIEKKTDMDHNQLVSIKVKLSMFYPTSDCLAINHVQQLAFIANRLLPKDEKRSFW
jgi:hypothetical protein